MKTIRVIASPSTSFHFLSGVKLWYCWWGETTMGGFDAGGSVESAGGGAVWSPRRKIIWRPIGCGLCLHFYCSCLQSRFYYFIYFIHLILSWRFRISHENRRWNQKINNVVKGERYIERSAVHWKSEEIKYFQEKFECYKINLFWNGKSIYLFWNGGSIINSGSDTGIAVTVVQV